MNDKEPNSKSSELTNLCLIEVDSFFVLISF